MEDKQKTHRGQVTQTPNTDAYLPMFHGSRATQITRDEWCKYRLLREQHLRLDHRYDDWWQRPSRDTSTKVWNLLESSLKAAEIRLDEFLPGRNIRPVLSPEDLDDLRELAKQALVVTLDVFVSTVDSGRTVTYNHVMDALARCWSDHFRQAVEEDKAYRIKDMTLWRAKACRRDLLCVGVPFASLWNRIIVEWSAPRRSNAKEADPDRNPLFYTEGLLRGKQALSWAESVKATAVLADFDAILREDKHYRRVEIGPRLLVAGDPDDDDQPAEPRQRIAAERDYNKIEFGEKSTELLKLQERTLLVLQAEAVRRSLAEARQAARKARKNARRLGVDPALSTYAPGPGRSKREKALDLVRKRYRGRAKKLIAAYDKSQGHVLALKPVEARLAHGTPEPIIIKSKFVRSVNRRWQPVHFWPVFVTAKHVVWDDEAEAGLSIPPRADWFRFIRTTADNRDVTTIAKYSELTSLDVSSSQSSILALFLGLDAFEKTACSEAPYFKDFLADVAKRIDAVVPTGLNGSDVGTLADMCKETWMQVLYGSTVSKIIRRQEDELWQYRWREGSPTGATRFLREIPFYPDVQKFLYAVRHLSRVAHDRDPYEGVVLADPFDMARVRWNPIRRRSRYLASNGQKLLVSLPLGRRCKDGAYKNDAPVSREQLRRSTAPMLVHMLDAYFSALVLQRLDGIPAIGIHDAWVVPRERLDDLARAIDDAAGEWFRGLGGIYDTLIRYLVDYDTDRKYADWARDIKARWDARCHCLADRPIRFATKAWGTSFGTDVDVAARSRGTEL